MSAYQCLRAMQWRENGLAAKVFTFLGPDAPGSTQRLSAFEQEAAIFLFDEYATCLEVLHYAADHFA